MLWCSHLALYSLLLLLMSAPVLALDRSLRIDQYEHTRWGPREGLPGQVGALAQTRDGYLWLGTGQTLYHFDGVQFEAYQAPDGEAVRTVSTLYAGPGGELWVGFRRGGIARVEAGRITRFGRAEGLPEGAVLGLNSDADGRLWATTRTAVLTLNQGRWQRPAEAESLPEGVPGALHLDAEGSLWLAIDRALFRLRRGAARFEAHSVIGGRIVDLQQAADGSLWATQVDPPALRRVAPVDEALQLALPLASASLRFDRDGALWLATRGEGLLRIAAQDATADTSVEGARIEVFRAEAGLSADYLGPLLEDRQGSLWIGSSAGLDRLRETPLVNAGFPSGAHAFALAAAGDGAVWAATLNRTAMRMVDGRYSDAAVPPPVQAVHAAADGSVWLAGPNGLWRSLGATAERVAELPAGLTGAVRALAVDAAGVAWVSIDDAGLFRWQGGGWHAEAPHFDGRDQRMPVSAAREPNGRLWFGYRNNAALSVDARAGVRRWSPSDGLAVGNVTVVHPGPTWIWVGGTAGLARFDGERFHTLHAIDREGFGIVTGLVESATGDLWVHGVNGIVRVLAEDIRRVGLDPANRVRRFAIEPVHGLVDDPTHLRPLPTAVGDRAGRLWFATSSGVSVLDPARLHADEPAASVHITHVRVDDVAQALAGPVVFPAQSRRITISYSAPTLNAAERTHFRHRLLGLDESWRDVGALREAVFTALAPGDYRFEVMAVLGDADNASAPATFAFRIPPAFHQTPQFMLLWAVLAAGLGFAIHRLRVQRIKASLRTRQDARRDERTRIARELHDTLLQGMQGTLLRLQAAADALPEGERARQSINEAIDRAEQVLIEGRDRVQGIRDFDGATSGLEQRIEALAAELNAEGELALRVVRRGEPAALTPETHDEVLRIVREAVLNACQHAAPSLIEVLVEWSASELRLVVRDDGSGIEPEVLRRGRRPGHWGMAGMRERASMIGATLDIRSAAGVGTEVELRVPCRRMRSRWWHR